MSSLSGGECWANGGGCGAEAWRVQLALPEAAARPSARGVSGSYLAAGVLDLYPAFRLATNSASAPLTASSSGGECWANGGGCGAEAWRVQLALPEAAARPLARGLTAPHLAAEVRCQAVG